MAKTIKGITVEIGGNATPLNKALNDVNKTSRSLQSELRTVDKLLKLDPTNVNLLKQKEDILNESIATTEEKLNRLKSAQEQVEQSFKSGKMGEDEYRAFQRNVITTEQKLTSLRAELSKTETSFTELGTTADKSSKHLDDYKDEVDKVKESVDKLKETGSGIAKTLGATTAAVGGAAVAAVISSDSVESAMNTMQAATGKSDSEMKQYRNTLQSIYTDNFGESLEDIAQKMSMVVQYTNESDPDKIKAYTENLFGLQDTFDMDISETLRGVNGLITNMGLDADTAFDLIASGAQNGLNYSGELGDNIAEYSQLWGQAGFSAQEMFKILDNGTESGAYNLDKVNDFVKEFTISLADGRIEDSLDSFSDNTGNLFRKWQDGKATASDVFYSVINDLSTATNNQEALTLASNTWSALGEDNAMEVITSLSKVNDKFDDTKGTMDKVNNVKYDDISNRVSALGRKVQTEIINPTVTEYLPEIENGIDWVSDHLDLLIPIVKGVATEMGVIWTAKKANEFAKAVSGVITTYKSLKQATDSAKVAQEALNFVQNTNAIGLIIGLVGTLGTVMMTLNDVMGDDVKKTSLLTEEQEKLYDSIDKNKSSWDELTQKRQDSSADITSEYGYYEDLYDELQDITEENGNVKKGYEDRATVITDTLSKALDIEIEKNGNCITDYQNICKEIENIMIVEKARAEQSAYLDSYNEAITNQTQAWKDYQAAQDNLIYTNTQLALLQKDYENAEKEANRTVQTSTGLQKVHTQANDEAILKYQALGSALNQAKKSQEKASTAVGDAQSTYLGYISTIQNYDGVTSAIASADTQKINDAMNKMVNNFVTAENGTKESLERQVADMKSNYESLKTAVDESAPGVTQTMVDNAKTMVDDAVTELDKFQEKAPESAQKGVDGYTDVLNSDDTSNACKDGGENLINKTDEGGSDSYEHGYTVGDYYSKGYYDGIGSYWDQVAEKSAGLVRNAMEASKKEQDSHSPSKKTRQLGQYYGEGYVLGIEDKEGAASKAGSALAGSALSALKAKNNIMNHMKSVSANSFTVSGISNSHPSAAGISNNNSVNLGGLTLKIEHFENSSNADVKNITEQVMYNIENYINRKRSARG